jgi:hypothetical protein
MEKLKDTIIKFAFRLTIFSVLWSRITMRVTRKIGTKVKKFEDVKQIPKEFNYGREYRWDQFLGTKSDHLTHPTRLQWRLDNDQEFGDCDDHAIYWCVSLIKSKLAKKVWFAFYSMKSKDDKTGKTERTGHAVCVFVGLDDQLYWCDYRNPRKIQKIEDFMHQSAGSYNAEPVVGCIWLVKDLKDDDTPIFGKRTRLLP